MTGGFSTGVPLPSSVIVDAVADSISDTALVAGWRVSTGSNGSMAEAARGVS